MKKLSNIEKHKQFLPFDKALEFVHSLGLNNYTDWYVYCKSGNKPDNIPTYPNETYKNKGWISWGDWLGTGVISNQKRNFLSFIESKSFAKKLGLKSRYEWRDFHKSGKLPHNIPTHPDRQYKNKGWISWGDFLGSGNVQPKQKKSQYVTFEDARQYVRSLKLKNRKEWRAFSKSTKRPYYIPPSPEKTYKNEWKGMSDWLGNDFVLTRNRSYVRFEEAIKFVHALELKTQEEWRQYTKSGKKPDDIPTDPAQVYKKEWKRMGDWLGTGVIASRVKSKNYLSWSEAKPLYQKLKEQYNLKNLQDWYDLVESGKTPDNLPKYPDQVYTIKRTRNLLNN